MVLSFGLSAYVAKKAGEKFGERAEVATTRTDVSKVEKLGYSVAPVTAAVVDLVKGNSFQEVGDKIVLTTKAHVDGTKKAVKNVSQGAIEVARDANEGPVKNIFKYSALGALINIFAD